jgi:uncharacterized membrane protein
MKTLLSLTSLLFWSGLILAQSYSSPFDRFQIHPTYFEIEAGEVNNLNFTIYNRSDQVYDTLEIKLTVDSTIGRVSYSEETLLSLGAHDEEQITIEVVPTHTFFKKDYPITVQLALPKQKKTQQISLQVHPSNAYQLKIALAFTGVVILLFAFIFYQLTSKRKS